MRFRAGGVRFSAGPDAALLACERESIDRLDPDAPEDDQPPVAIELLDTPPWTSDDPTLYPQWEPAVQRWSEGRLLCSHRSFTAEVDPFACRVRLHRREARAYPLEAVIRTAMVARLPLIGGLPLHAAGVVVAGRGIALFGPSGAGKTTVASTAPFPVLSDELVAVVPGPPFGLVRSGFWGEGKDTRREPAAVLALLVDLAKGPALSLTRVAPVAAAGRLLASAPVPPAPPLWARALAVAASLVREVPVQRMEWAPEEPPWERLAEMVGSGEDQPRTSSDLDSPDGSGTD